MFTTTGQVVVYGVSASVVYGFLPIGFGKCRLFP